MRTFFLASFAWRSTFALLLAMLVACPEATGQINQLPRTPNVRIGNTTVDPGGQVLLPLDYDEGIFTERPDRFVGQLIYAPGSFSAVSNSSNCLVRRSVITGQEIGRVDFTVDAGFFNPIPSGRVCFLTFTAASRQPTASAQALDLTVTCSRWNGDSYSGVACNAFDGSITVNQANFGSNPAPGAAIDIVTTTTSPRTEVIAMSNSGTFATQISYAHSCGVHHSQEQLVSD